MKSATPDLMSISQPFSYKQVTCGSLIKLENEKTRHMLHSHEVNYGTGRGSGQQSVTGFPEKDSSQSLWIVRGGEVSGAVQEPRPVELPIFVLSAP